MKLSNIIPRLIKASRYSFNGLQTACKKEEAFQLELLLSIFILPLALWLGDTGTERALLIGSWLLILIIELINSAIEALTDRISTEHHELSKQAKDLGSAAVFVAIVTAVVVWLVMIF